MSSHTNARCSTAYPSDAVTSPACRPVCVTERDCGSESWKENNWRTAYHWYLHSVSPLPQQDAFGDAPANSILFSWLPARQKHDFSEETLDLVTEISLNLLDSQSTGKGLRKDQSVSFQLELFHYSWMWHNYKRCCMWNLIRII